MLVTASVFAQHSYTFTNLEPSQQYGYFSATAVNDSGTVVGDFDARAGVWSGGAYSTLPDLGFGARARGVNDQGVIAGTVYHSGGQSEAAIWRKGTLMLLGRQNGFDTAAVAVNDSGHVLIQSAEANYTKGYLFDGSSYALITLPAYGSLTDLNDNDVVCGWSTGMPPGESGGFLWEGGVLTSMGTGTFDPFQPLSLTNNKVAAGNTGGESFIWESGMFVSAAGYPDRFRAMNNLKDIVGERSAGDERALIWLGGYSRYYLDDLTSMPTNYSLKRAAGISDTGYIVGTAKTLDGGVHSSFLLTPVPEPATMAVFGLGLFAFLKRRRA